MTLPDRRLADLLEAFDERQRLKWLFFWGHIEASDEVTKACLSQWYPSPFSVGEHHYASVEHWMMAEKARLFGDEEALGRVLASNHPGEAKAIGREVRGFDLDRWKAARYRIVVHGNVTKFSTYPGLSRFLLTTGDRVLVEASPVDRVWGIGLSADDTRAQDPSLWRGLNLLGFALMEVRERLRATSRP
ncbi:MAG: NADAR family protein [Bacteroidota bacterium]